MSQYKSAYTLFMDQHGIKYIDHDEKAVTVSYNAENAGTIRVLVIFDDNNGNSVHLMCVGLSPAFGDNNFAAGLTTCNLLNARYRWVKFYLNSEKKYCVELDAVVDMATVGDECSELVQRIVSIVDKAYPEMMKAIWG